MRRVLDTLREKGGWGRKLPAGTAQGVAIHEVVGTVVAQLAEVNVSKSGEVRVERVVTVLDPGHLANPLTVEEQVESSIVWALSATLFGRLTVENGVVQESNFDTYRILRIAETPQIETHFSLSKSGKWGGIGEAPVPTVAPAVTNAIFRASGKRVRSLPLLGQSLAWG
jgi:isoquinoline 1-oxidoreductase beta subunit